MTVIVTRVTIEALNNVISCSYEGRNAEMLWDKFTNLMPPPFDLENLFYVGFEPDRNLYCVERRGGIINGKEGEEIIWIEANLNSIISVIEQNL